jgi:hypothetical protein
MIVGVDFDNTIVNYNELFEKLAVEKGFYSSLEGRSKKEIRDFLRTLPNGDVEWQKLQAIAYGERIGEAVLFENVWEFFVECKKNNAEVYIISHKTEFAAYDENRTNLREAATSWLSANHFFSEPSIGMNPESVFFLPTRKEKILKIVSLDCSIFIDDLEETFAEPSFPKHVDKILFSADNGVVKAKYRTGEIHQFSSWREISHSIFLAK